jgi:cytochrome b6-f complex iron-sulfur subunit
MVGFVVLGLSQSTFAVIIVAVLFVLFVLLLLGTLARARRPEGAEPKAREPRAPRPKTIVSRRDFLRTAWLGSLAVFAANFGGATIAFLWPNLKGGFGSVITLTDTPQSIMSDITSSRQPFYFGAGRFYLINYTGDGDKPGGIYDGLTATVPGQSGRIMALYQKCAHLGCRVPFCQQSQWFECPCHGSKYNYAGEYQLGPAPNGLQRFPVKLAGSQIQVDTGNPTAGPPRGTDTIHQSPEGPFCV